MNITPDTNIRLLKCPLKLNNKHQLTFANVNAQTTYFLSLTHLEVEGSMYQRKDNAIFYPGLYDDLIGYNYVMYQNENYSNKWFYAFITSMEYLNDNTTKISILTDVFQTWQFDIVYKYSFIEREMININEDVPGANLLPENLETGEYKIAGTGGLSSLLPNYVWAYSGDSIKLGPNGTSYSLGVANTYYVNGIHTSVHFIVASNDTGYATIATGLQLYDNQSEKVVAHFSVPSLAVNSGNTNDFTSGALSGVYLLAGKATPATKTLSARPTTIDGYTPVNKKLLTYPYLYLGFNPRQGSSKIYRYEDFTNATPSFKFISEINPNPTVYMIPQNYRGDTGDSLADSASLNGYPQIASKVDVYNSWVAENSGIINVQQSQAYGNVQYDTALGTANLVGNIGQATIGAMTGESSGPGLGSVFTSALNMYKTGYNYDKYIEMINAQKERQQMLPDNVSLGGSNATLLGYELIDDKIFTRYNIKAEFAVRIDGYFNMFGYQTNRIKIPYISNRPFWNYVKTQGINLLGDIPNEDLEVIKSLFDNGITLWHNPAYFLDYSQNNKATS